MNPLILYPYLLADTCWVFDDAEHGLKEEAFVSGATEMISKLVEAKGIPNAEHGFKLTFSAEPFDGYDAELRWVRADDEHLQMNGNWYEGEVAGELMECWLCPALLKYFEEAPAKIYARAEPLPEGIDPIWDDEQHGTRFVEPLTGESEVATFQQHPFVQFRLRHQLSEDTVRQIFALLGHLGEMAANSTSMESEQVEVELYAILPKDKHTRPFLEELLRSWEPHQFDYLREYMRSKGWNC